MRAKAGGQGCALGAGTGGCGAEPEMQAAARPGRCRAEDGRGALGGEARGPREEAAGGARSRSTAAALPSRRLLSAQLPPRAGWKPRVRLREPSLASPRPASRSRLGAPQAGAGRGARRAAAAPEMSGPRAGFYRLELTKTLWEVPQRLQGCARWARAPTAQSGRAGWGGPGRGPARAPPPRCGVSDAGRGLALPPSPGLTRIRRNERGRGRRGKLPRRLSLAGEGASLCPSSPGVLPPGS